MLVRAHAKINLALEVLGTRADGYHELETVMQTLALHDEIELHPAPAVELAVEGSGLTTGPENLARRAADLLRRRAGYGGGVRIILRKRIPLAAGLAGGSADAAAVLRGLNRLWELNLGREELWELSSEIGSDVPFCLTGGTALCRGRGEMVFPLPPPPQAGVLLVKPGFGVSTAEVYRRFDRLAEPARPGCARVLSAIDRGDIEELAAGLGNSLEQVVITMHPEIGRIKKEVAAAGALGVLMSGSGPTVFGIFRDYDAAARAARAVKSENRWVMATMFHQPVKEDY